MYRSRLAMIAATMFAGLGHLAGPRVMFVPKQIRDHMPLPSGKPRRSTLHGNYCGKRQRERYARQDKHEQQRRSHDPSWQAMNKHLREHLFGA